MISLYGGAFIIGILTTAAGAILYEVLGLTMALIIAVIFIGYGIALVISRKMRSLHYLWPLPHYYYHIY